MPAAPFIRRLASWLRGILPPRRGGAPGDAYRALAAMPYAERRALMEAILDEVYAARADGAATLTPRAFLAEMTALNRQAVIASAQVGAGGPLTVAEAARVQAVVLREEAFLRQFADEIAARRALERAGGRAAMSERQIAARARMYAGTARAEFYRAASARQPAGVVARYRAVDDGGTCSACAEAERASPYLPSGVPLPGSVCFGRGHCRCSVTFEEDADAYARLTGQRQAA